MWLFLVLLNGCGSADKAPEPQPSEDEIIVTTDDEDEGDDEDTVSGGSNVDVSTPVGDTQGIEYEDFYVQPVNLSHSESDSTLPQMAEVNDGYKHIFWRENNAIRYLHRLNDGEIPDSAVITDSEMFVDDAQITALSVGAIHGVVHLAFSTISSANNQSALYYLRAIDFGDQFSSPALLQNGIDSSTLSLDKYGNLAIAWQDLETDSLAYTLSSDDGESFSFAYSINAVAKQDIRLAYSPAGLFISWLETDTLTLPALHVAEMIDGTLTDETVISSQISTASQGEFVSDAAGNLYLVWLEEREGSHGLYFAVSADNGKQFSTPRLLSDATADAACASLTVTSDGELHVVWSVVQDESEDSGESSVYTSYRTKSGDAGSRFSEPVALDFIPETSKCPVIGGAGYGGLEILWQALNPESGYQDIFYAELAITQ